MKQNLRTTNPPLYAFLDSCLFDKGIKDVTEELKEQMILDLADRLQQWLMQSVFMHLPESAAPEMEKLMDKGASQEEIMEFLQRRVPNISKIFEEEMFKFKQVYLGNDPFGKLPPPPRLRWTSRAGKIKKMT